jgi:carbon-monoxide dehydrogenase small subunit
MSKKIEISFKLNGKNVMIYTEPQTRLLDLIRDEMGLKGTKEGCGIGECGTCTVLMDGKSVNSCMVTALAAKDSEIVTIEGLGEDRIVSIIKNCFVEEGAVQCGFCTPGMIISAYALLLENPTPTKEEIKYALAGNACRCTGYMPIVKAVERASKEIGE